MQQRSSSSLHTRICDKYHKNRKCHRWLEQVGLQEFLTLSGGGLSPDPSHPTWYRNLCLCAAQSLRPTVTVTVTMTMTNNPVTGSGGENSRLYQGCCTPGSSLLCGAMPQDIRGERSCVVRLSLRHGFTLAQRSHAPENTDPGIGFVNPAGRD